MYFYLPTRRDEIIVIVIVVIIITIITSSEKRRYVCLFLCSMATENIIPVHKAI